MIDPLACGRRWAMVDMQTVIIVGLVGYILGLLTALRSATKAR